MMYNKSTKFVKPTFSLVVNIFDEDAVWETSPTMNSRFIDGVEFLHVRKQGDRSWFLMRKESLKPYKKPVDNPMFMG